MADCNSILTYERLTSVFRYEKDTGQFFRIKPTRGCRLGESAGHVNANGYVVIMIDKINYQAHRLAWLYHFGEWPSQYVDHIDGDKLNNRIDNLRGANKSENGQNVKKARTDSSSGILGATPHGKGWRSMIQINGVTIRLGTYKSKEEAHSAYINAKRELHPFGTL